MGGSGEGCESRGRVFQAEGVRSGPPKWAARSSPWGRGAAAGPSPWGSQRGAPQEECSQPTPRTAQPGDPEPGPRGRGLNWLPDSSSPEP